MEKLTLEHLGRAKKITVDKNDTTIVQGAGKTSDIQQRIAQLKRQIEQTDSDYDREKLQERLAKLTGGVAIVSVGAETEAVQRGMEMPRPFNENLLRVQRLTNEMLALADEGDEHRDDPACGIIYGILRDMAYQLRRLAQQECEKHKTAGKWD